MAATRLTRIAGTLLLWGALSAAVGAQAHLGPLSLVPMPAIELRNPLHLSIGLASQAFVATVGGVAFDAVAVPAGGSLVTDLTLSYRPDMPDGDRLALSVNGHVLSAPLPDWQLIPIARYADSPYYSVFTLFGRLLDSAQEKQILDAGGRIMNYHPAFADTLLGLRLFQLDILILYGSAADLPREGEAYVLGRGEGPPELRSNRIGSRLFGTYLTLIQSELGMEHRSYVISDYGTSIAFDASGATLRLSGDPYYYFWRYRRDEPDYDPQAAQNRIAADIRRAVEAARSGGAGAFSERGWLIDALILEAARYERSYRVFSGGTIVDLVAVQGETERRAFLGRYATDSLYQLLGVLRSAMEAHEVLHLKEYSDMASSKPELLRGINPAVWDSAVSTMRYAAFFRYCKQSFPETWNGFMHALASLTPQPQVRTPTVMTGEESEGARR